MGKAFVNLKELKEARVESYEKWMDSDNAGLWAMKKIRNAF